MRTTTIIITFILILFISASCKNQEPQSPDKMEWFRDARFGLFIHWGLYSIPAGEWDGKMPDGDAACIRDVANIPLEKYDELMLQFNPEKFNADEWVTLAKKAGMKYVVVTTKHHDGFCLFDSKETDYDIMSTPFKRDVLAELSDACAEQGIEFCVYYSIMDWHHPDYLPRRSWETDRVDGDSNFDKYIGYAKNQVKELLSNYGRVGLVWFDGEWENTWNIARAKDVYGFARKLQPGLILKTGHGINGKGHYGTVKMDTDSCYFSDYGTPSPKTIPSTGIPGTDWENILVMNRNWGYDKNDQEWKSSKELVRRLIENTSKGGNFLLNVGPTAEGLFPDSATVRLKEMGSWLEENGEAIYGTQASPFEKLKWGRCTQREIGNKTILYLHVFDWPEDGNLIIPGMENKIVKAYALKDKASKKLPLTKEDVFISLDVNGVEESEFATVIALEMKGKPAIANILQQ